MIWFFGFFFFKQKTAYEMRISDWSSDVCSSDLFVERQAAHRVDREVGDQLLVAERRAAEPRAPERAQELHLADDDLDEATAAHRGGGPRRVRYDVLRPDGDHERLTRGKAVGGAGETGIAQGEAARRGQRGLELIGFAGSGREEERPNGWSGGSEGEMSVG